MINMFFKVKKFKSKIFNAFFFFYFGSKRFGSYLFTFVPQYSSNNDVHLIFNNLQYNYSKNGNNDRNMVLH